MNVSVLLGRPVRADYSQASDSAWLSRAVNILPRVEDNYLDFLNIDPRSQFEQWVLEVVVVEVAEARMLPTPLISFGLTSLLAFSLSRLSCQVVGYSTDWCGVIIRHFVERSLRFLDFGRRSPSPLIEKKLRHMRVNDCLQRHHIEDDPIDRWVDWHVG